MLEVKEIRFIGLNITKSGILKVNTQHPVSQETAKEEEDLTPDGPSSETKKSKQSNKMKGS